MYINFKYLIVQGFPLGEFLKLQMVFQKEFNLLELKELQFLLEEGMVVIKSKYPKIESVRITKQGKAFLTQATTPSYTEEVGVLVSDLVATYQSYDQNIGKELAVQKRLSWFLLETGFSSTVIKATIMDYLATAAPQRAMWLQNIVWKPSSVYDKHFKLEDSYLYALICRKYNLPVTFLTGKRSKELEYLFQLSRLRPTRGSFYATGTLQGDKEIKLEAGQLLRKQIKR